MLTMPEKARLKTRAHSRDGVRLVSSKTRILILDKSVLENPFTASDQVNLCSWSSVTLSNASHRPFQ